LQSQQKCRSSRVSAASFSYSAILVLWKVRFFAHETFPPDREFLKINFLVNK
jgi:hypothetical protein